MSKRREQFNFRTSLLSDEAYKLIEHLSETRQLSKQIAVWAEQELSQHTPQNETSTEILKEIKTIKLMLQTATLHTRNPHTEELVPTTAKKEALQLVSSDQVNSVIDDEDESYDY